MKRFFAALGALCVFLLNLGGFTGGNPGDKPASTEVLFRYPAPPPEPLP